MKNLKSRHEICGKSCCFYNKFGRHSFAICTSPAFKNCPCITCIVNTICTKMCDELYDFFELNVFHTHSSQTKDFKEKGEIYYA